MRISLLTAGRDKPYALGMAEALASQGITLDFIGSDEVNGAVVLDNPRVSFLNLRGDQRPDTSLAGKIRRVLAYYLRLIRYAAIAKPRIFHILWNNKFEWFDRTALLLYYKLLGKRIVFTAHNVNAGKRDANDTWLNRFSLRIQYRLVDHIFVHTNNMKCELVRDFNVREGKVSVIPFGINNSVPNTKLTAGEAKRILGLSSGDKVILFFGNIAPYKGLEYLIAAFTTLASKSSAYRLLITGKPKQCENYWNKIQQDIARSGVRDRIIAKIEYVPDEQTELYFKAADVLVLPYTHVFQSGVLFLGYSFGLPVIATDVASLREEIIEGETGFVSRPQDPVDLARVIHTYFGSELFMDLENRRRDIRDYASEKYSWSKVGQITKSVYATL